MVTVHHYMIIFVVMHSLIQRKTKVSNNIERDQDIENLKKQMSKRHPVEYGKPKMKNKDPENEDKLEFSCSII